MKIMYSVLGIVIFSLLPACLLQRPLKIDPGLYLLSKNTVGDEGTDTPAIETLQVNREKNVLFVIFENGDSLTIPYSVRSVPDWPTGCPGNLYSQKMEVIDLWLDDQGAAILWMEKPVLVRNCPEDPYELVLREDGEIGGPSTACPYPVPCLYFKPDHQ